MKKLMVAAICLVTLIALGGCHHYIHHHGGHHPHCMNDQANPETLEENS